MYDYTTANAGSYLLTRVVDTKNPVPKGPQLKWFLVAVTLLLGLFWPVIGRAESTDKAAHLGISYTATMIGYGVSKAFVNRSCRLAPHVAEHGCPLTPTQRLGAAGFAAFAVLLGGLVKESLDARSDGQDMLYNAVGVVSAVGTILVFEF